MLTRQEEESKIQNLRSNGIHLVNLIALFPIKDFETAKRDFLLRTLSEYTSQEGLIYLFIHDNTGKPIISFAPGNTSSQIPEHVKMQSLFTMGLAEQSFKTAVSGEIVYEFAKPIFERGEKAGTVRLGLRFRPCRYPVLAAHQHFGHDNLFIICCADIRLLWNRHVS